MSLKEPLKTLPIISRLWQRISLTFRDSSKGSILTAILYSKWFEFNVESTDNIMAIAKLIKEHFSRYCIPHLMDDNGSHVSSLSHTQMRT